MYSYLSFSRLRLGSKDINATRKALPILRDLDQPFCFNLHLKSQPYQLQFSDTASPENYTLLHPSIIILCYSIASPESLTNIQGYWKKLVETHFNYDEALPVILLGLMRDVRQKEDYDGRVRRMDGGGIGEADVLNGRRLVYPQEGVRVAQEMRCDRYCECSAFTGDVSISTGLFKVLRCVWRLDVFLLTVVSKLCREVFEDIATTAAMTTTAKGGKTPGWSCCVM